MHYPHKSTARSFGIDHLGPTTSQTSQSAISSEQDCDTSVGHFKRVSQLSLRSKTAIPLSYILPSIDNHVKHFFVSITRVYPSQTHFPHSSRHPVSRKALMLSALVYWSSPSPCTSYLSRRSYSVTYFDVIIATDGTTAWQSGALHFIGFQSS